MLTFPQKLSYYKNIVAQNKYTVYEKKTKRKISTNLYKSNAAFVMKLNINEDPKYQKRRKIDKR